MEIPVHTPGPWKANRWLVAAGVDTDDFSVICHTANNNKTRTPENQANACLIAKSPELLDCLELLIELFECDDESNTPGTDAYTAIYRAKFVAAEARGITP